MSYLFVSVINYKFYLYIYTLAIILNRNTLTKAVKDKSTQIQVILNLYQYVHLNLMPQYKYGLKYGQIALVDHHGLTKTFNYCFAYTSYN